MFAFNPAYFFADHQYSCLPFQTLYFSCDILPNEKRATWLFTNFDTTRSPWHYRRFSWLFLDFEKLLFFRPNFPLIVATLNSVPFTHKEQKVDLTPVYACGPIFHAWRDIWATTTLTDTTLEACERLQYPNIPEIPHFRTARGGTSCSHIEHPACAVGREGLVH